MALTLYFHPLSSFCQKVLIGLYELDVSFEKRVVDLNNEAERTAFAKLWPPARFPMLRDEANDQTVPESTVILEYVDREHRLIPADPRAALDARLRDRFFDLDVNVPMQKVVTDKLRPDGRHDPFGVERARAQLQTSYDVAEGWLKDRTWAVGEAFTIADCAAAPALFYAREVLPFGARPNLSAYFRRLLERPSVVRVFSEAKPYLSLFPGG